MAKVSFIKVAPVKMGEEKTVTINGTEVQVKQYLPLEDKVVLVENVLNQSIDDTNDFNYAKLKIFYAFELIKYYTNINLTDTLLKDAPKLYDKIILSNILTQIEQEIPKDELNFIKDMIETETNRIRTYFHSTAGVLNTIQQDYAQTDMNVDGLIKKLQTGENFELVKDILTKTN